jgi:hypothetical protein
MRARHEAMMAKPENIKVKSVIIAQDVRQEITGQQTLVGVFSGDIVTVQPPLMIPQLTFRIEYEVRDAIKSTFTFSIVSPSKSRIFVVGPPAELNAKKGNNTLVIRWTPAFLSEPGQYQIRFGTGEERIIDRFEVKFGSAPLPRPGDAPPIG